MDPNVAIDANYAPHSSLSNYKFHSMIFHFANQIRIDLNQKSIDEFSSTMVTQIIINIGQIERYFTTVKIHFLDLSANHVAISEVIDDAYIMIVAPILLEIECRPFW